MMSRKKEQQDQFPNISDFYKVKLLEPGWGGLLTLEEAIYIQVQLVKDARFRKRWGIRYIVAPLSIIAQKAFPENPAAARRHIRAQQARVRRRMRSKAKMSLKTHVDRKRMQ